LPTSNYRDLLPLVLSILPGIFPGIVPLLSNGSVRRLLGWLLQPCRNRWAPCLSPGAAAYSKRRDCMGSMDAARQAG
jgi:hypothetical protein